MNKSYNTNAQCKVLLYIMQSSTYLYLGNRQKPPVEPIRFWQMTDVHLDYYYEPTGDPADWCHEDTNSLTNAGAVGNYRCDGTSLVTESAINMMRVREPDPDFILWTGDTAPHWHDPTDPDWNYIFKAERNIVSKLKAEFPDTLILPALGNHDSFPADFFPKGEKF